MILRYLSTFVLLLLCVSQSGRVGGQFQCKDMKNQNVDWFVFYKLPKVKGSPSDSVADGTAFLYLDKNNKQWVYPTMNMLDGNHAIAYTLQQYYDRQDDSMIMSIFYNDEHPDNVTSSSLGHQK
ncbi:unnamed protein product, partial [Mesorhabditis belari]|uniref:Uncharacterized protein n=1 Tax=Mesorhabditis belari TaxID=2138241 RepID=A0AAF3F8E8_9BILA